MQPSDATLERARKPRARDREGAPASGLRGDIQGLRAVAVLTVVLGHAGFAGFAGGYVGVDVFFVISGFLITGILVREIRKKGRVSITEFYARRARRILPAASVTLLVVVLASAFMLQPARLHEVLAHVTWAALFGANLYSARTGSDYFSEGAFVSPVMHFWSLSVEEQFYLVWPALIVLVLMATKRLLPALAGEGEGDARVSRRRAERHAELRLRWVTLVLVVVCGLSFAWSVHRTVTEPTGAYYSPFTRTWELGAGALLALCADTVSRLPGRVKAALSWSGLAAIAVAVLQFNETTPFPGYHAALPVLGAVLVLAGGMEGPAYGARQVLDRPVMRWFGDTSYSLYLWHWPFLLLPSAYLARELTLIERLCLVALAIGASWLSYRYVETPFRSHRWHKAPRRFSLGLWPAAASLALVAVLVTGHLVPVPVATATAAAAPTDNRTPEQRVAEAVKQAKSEAEVPQALRPGLEDLWADVGRLPGTCMVGHEVTQVETCVVGDPKASRTMVIFGDSHMVMWRKPLENLAKEKGWRIVGITKSACFPMDATAYWGQKARAYTECDTWRADAYREIERIDPDKIVVSGWASLLMFDPESGKVASTERAADLFSEGTRSSLTRLKKVTSDVSVIGVTPLLEKNAGDCLGTTRSTMDTCTRPLLDSLAAKRDQWRAATQKAGARYVDPLPWMCAESLCPVVIDGVVVYRDRDHLTSTFALTLEERLRQSLRL